jgi:hypothetical protein
MVATSRFTTDADTGAPTLSASSSASIKGPVMKATLKYTETCWPFTRTLMVPVPVATTLAGPPADPGVTLIAEGKLVVPGLGQGVCQHTAGGGQPGRVAEACSRGHRDALHGRPVQVAPSYFQEGCHGTGKLPGVPIEAAAVGESHGRDQDLIIGLEPGQCPGGREAGDSRQPPPLRRHFAKADQTDLLCPIDRQSAQVIHTSPTSCCAYPQIQVHTRWACAGRRQWLCSPVSGYISVAKRYMP